MKVELFGYEAWLAQDTEGKYFAHTKTTFNVGDEKTIRQYIMFLELVDFYLRELNY